MSRASTTPGDLGWQSIVEPVFHNAAWRGDHPAIIDGEGTLTYNELAQLIVRTLPPASDGNQERGYGRHMPA